MKKKMTSKEFEDIIARCSINNSYENCLCMIANHFYDESTKMKRDGYVYAANWYKELSNFITNELQDRGYFD